MSKRPVEDVELSEEEKEEDGCPRQKIKKTLPMPEDNKKTATMPKDQKNRYPFQKKKTAAHAKRSKKMATHAKKKTATPSCKYVPIQIPRAYYQNL